MTTNRLAKPSGPNGKEKSPTDPQECCDWANNRLHPDAVDAGLAWYVTGNRDKPIELRKIAPVLRIADGSRYLVGENHNGNGGA